MGRMQTLKLLNKDATELEILVAGQLNLAAQGPEEIAKVAATVKEDFNAFAVITHFATEEQLEVRTHAIHQDSMLLAVQGNDFAVHLGGYIKRTKEVDANTQNHVSTALQ